MDERKLAVCAGSGLASVDLLSRASRPAETQGAGAVDRQVDSSLSAWKPGTMQTKGEDWSESELAIVVAEYGGMLRAQRAGQAYVKVRHNERVQQATERSKGSVEFKFCNISAVLRDAGVEWVKGYEPRGHYQAALRTAVEAAIPDW